MYGLFTPIILLQVFCVYHAYRKNADQRWFWLILFFPLFGSVIYLINNFNNRTTIHSLTENVKEAVNSNYKIERLEKALRFADTIKNKISLADAYLEIGRCDDAIPLYNGCLQGFLSDDPNLRMKLLNAHYMKGDYQEVIRAASDLQSEKSFKNSDERVAYAWALYHTGDKDSAQSVFEDMDRSYTNYFQRSEFCKFLIRTERPELAREKLSMLLDEFDQMQHAERRLKKEIYREIRDLYETARA